MDNYFRNFIISPLFCIPEKIHVTIVRKPLSITDGNFIVTDKKGNINWKVKEKLLSLHSRHVIMDFENNPILNFKKKILSAHKRWQVFRGDSSNSGDMLFSAKQSSILQFKTELDVFLSENVEEKSWDFKVVGSWFERSCVIYNKDSKPIAKMHKKHTFGSVVLGKDTFEVEVYPDVDYAFIVALVLILYEINEDKVD